MLNVSNMLGLTSLMITTSLTTLPFCEIYQTMKPENQHQQQGENTVISLYTILITLSQYVIWMLYSFNYNSNINTNLANEDYYMLISFSYTTLLYLLYFNMYLFSINKKNYMLIYTLTIVSIVSFIYNYIPNWLIGLCGITLTSIETILTLRSLRISILNHSINANMNLSASINFSKVFGYFFMSLFWLLYALFNCIWCFVMANLLFMVMRLIEGVVFHWGIGNLNESSLWMRIVKAVLCIRLKDGDSNGDGESGIEDGKMKEMIMIKEDSNIQH